MESKNKRIIKEFEVVKSQRALVHPLFTQKTQYSKGLDIYLITAGHLWIYKLVETNGYENYLSEIIDYAIKKKSSLLEWEIGEEEERDIQNILQKYKMYFSKYINDNFKVIEHKEILDASKDKNHPYHRLTRLLHLAKVGMAVKCMQFTNGDMEDLLVNHGTIINSMYLFYEMNDKEEEQSIVHIPDYFKSIIMKNMECYVERTEMKYYPKIDTIMVKLTEAEMKFGSNWYLISDDEQVVISKVLYSFRIVKELMLSLIGLNGILSTFVTRTLFDNFWQTKYLIEKNEVAQYREFTLNRMRLHVLKRSDSPGVTSINDLLSEIDGGVFDPIPINGDYFTKSAREYAIELGIKDEYDKYYEYNSEFIHASLTAVYSGLMMQCSNPEHNRHLTIHPGGSKYIDSAIHIFEILNSHIDLVNNYLGYKVADLFDVKEYFFSDRKEFLNSMSKMTKGSEGL